MVKFSVALCHGSGRWSAASSYLILIHETKPLRKTISIEQEKTARSFREIIQLRIVFYRQNTVN
jgi:hypothetical protein